MIDAPSTTSRSWSRTSRPRSALHETLGFSLVYREIVADQGIEAVGVRTGDAVIELLRPR